MDVNDVERLVFGFEFWTPARIAQPRLVMGYECQVRGKLFSLRSEVYSPGPFDTLWDIRTVVDSRLITCLDEIAEASADPNG